MATSAPAKRLHTGGLASDSPASPSGAVANVLTAAALMGSAGAVSVCDVSMQFPRHPVCLGMQNMANLMALMSTYGIDPKGSACSSVRAEHVHVVSAQLLLPGLSSTSKGLDAFQISVQW
jgi:hypothetical protein